MAGKPDLAATPGVQNVVVYVSNDNFAQAYAAVGQQQQANVAPNHSSVVHNAGYTNTSHSMAAVVGPSKPYPDKQQASHLKAPDFATAPNNHIVNNVPSGGYFISQNGFQQHQPIAVNNSYQNGSILNQVKNYNGGNNDVLSGERQAGPGRPDLVTNNKVVRDDCDNHESGVSGFVDSTNAPANSYVSVMGAEGPSQSVRCDSVRSETAESSCSSLSSADDGMILVQSNSSSNQHHHSHHQPNEMVVYDPSLSVRPNSGSVVFAVGPNSLSQQNINNNNNNNNNTSSTTTNFITVPYRWKRILNSGSIIYISPSNTALSSAEQVKDYLLTAGTCKCGLECHFKYDNTFNFDPKVASKPWTLSPDTNTEDLTKLCNHKRKIIGMASLDCKPPDLNVKLQKDCHSKKSKRKMGLPYTGCVSISPIFNQPEKHVMNCSNKETFGIHSQVWPQSPTSSSNQMNSRLLQNYQDHPPKQHLVRYQGQQQQQDHQQNNRILNNSPLVLGSDGTTLMVQTAPPPNNISHPHQNSSPNIHVHHQHIIGPNGQVISVQHGPPINSNQVSSNVPSPQQQQQQQQINQLLNTSLIANSGNGGGVVIQGQNVMQHHHQQQQQQQRVFINSQPNEPSGPGRPNIQMIPVGLHQQHQKQFYNNQIQYSQQMPQQYDGAKQVRPAFHVGGQQMMMNNFRAQNLAAQQPSQIMQGPVMINNNHSQKIHWTNNNNRVQSNTINQSNTQQQINNFERVPSLNQHTPPPMMWPEEIKRKKMKIGKNRSYHMSTTTTMECDQQQQQGHPCPNIDVRQITNENGVGGGSRSVIINHLPNNQQQQQSPSFLEDPSGYLAQQTALLNNTINRQTGVNNCPIPSNSSQSPIPTLQITNNEVPLPSNVVISSHHIIKPSNRSNQKQQQQMQQQQSQQQQISHNISIIPQQQYNQMLSSQNVVDSSDHNSLQCQNCVVDNKMLSHRPNSSGATNGDDPSVTSSTTYSDKNNSPDLRPIQGGTVSTSNVSPVMDGSDPPTPNSQTPPAHRNHNDGSGVVAVVYNQQGQIHQVNQSREICSSVKCQQNRSSEMGCCGVTTKIITTTPYITTGVVTTMASGRTVGSNTITSVLAGRANTATVSINSPASIAASTPPTSSSGCTTQQQLPLNIAKSPLEMVQSVVSSIQVPPPHSQNTIVGTSQISPPTHLVKHSPTAATGLPPGHILVSSNGQLIMANTSGAGPTNVVHSQAGGVMPPPPPKLMSNHHHHHQNSNGGAMPPISVSPMITNVTAAVSQVIPAVAAQQVLGQQTVLVNALPAPFVLQPGVTMTMDGQMVGQNTMQLPQLVAGNVIQQQIQIENGAGGGAISNNGTDPRRPSLLSPEITKKKGKKRKMSSQTVANMLHIAAAAAAQQNSGVVMSQQGFPQQIQMAHSPQGLQGSPAAVMQALTIVPSKTGGPPQIVMNGQATMSNANHLGAQQLIAANSQPTQQINLLQPVNLINGATGVVQNFPTIQQFIVPNLGGMVMNPDGTATLLQDTSNIGMQLQLQNVNGQNVLTPVQNNGMFNGGQSILTASPAGMVIRAPTTSQGKLIQHHPHHQQQQHSPGAAQFLSPNGGQFVVNGAQFSGQLSPLVANVSPSQQVTFGTTSTAQQIRPNSSQMQANHHHQPTEFIQCGQMGQTLMAVPVSNPPNTTFVQQNTTIVQQQTTMVSNSSQQMQNLQGSSANTHQNQVNLGAAGGGGGRTTTLNVDQNFIISSNDKVQALLMQQRDSPHYRHSVSTQTAVNQNNAQTVTTFCQTSTLSAGSPPDTTTHSPIASGGQSPHTADTTTHSGSTDDGLSPAPSNSSSTVCDSRQQSCTMAMVHCISSSEPDSGDLSNTPSNSEQDWSRVSSINLQQQQQHHHQHQKSDLSDGQIHFKKSSSSSTHLAYAESSTIGLQFIEQIKAQEAVVSSHNFDKLLHKRKNNDNLLIMETHHQHHNMHSSLFNDEEDIDAGKTKNEPTSSSSPSHKFVVGDLVWGPANKTYPAWPGKIIELNGNDASVKWFGSEKFITKKLDIATLQTLTEGLDTHHHAQKKYRTSRKLNSNLENAIQEAMAELDKGLEQQEQGGLVNNNNNKDEKIHKTKKMSGSNRIRRISHQ